MIFGKQHCERSAKLRIQLLSTSPNNSCYFTLQNEMHDITWSNRASVSSRSRRFEYCQHRHGEAADASKSTAGDDSIEQKEDHSKDRPLRNSIHNSQWHRGGHRWGDELYVAAELWRGLWITWSQCHWGHLTSVATSQVCSIQFNSSCPTLTPEVTSEKKLSQCRECVFKQKRFQFTLENVWVCYFLNCIW